MRAAGFIVLVVGNLALALPSASESSTRIFDSRQYLGSYLRLLAPYSWGPDGPFLSEIFRMAPPGALVVTMAVFVAVAAGGMAQSGD